MDSGLTVLYTCTYTVFPSKSPESSNREWPNRLQSHSGGNQCSQSTMITWRKTTSLMRRRRRRRRSEHKLHTDGARERSSQRRSERERETEREKWSYIRHKAIHLKIGRYSWKTCFTTDFLSQTQINLNFLKAHFVYLYTFSYRVFFPTSYSVRFSR